MNHREQLFEKVISSLLRVLNVFPEKFGDMTRILSAVLSPVSPLTHIDGILDGYCARRAGRGRLDHRMAFLASFQTRR